MAAVARITPEEIAGLMAYGVERIYHPQDGMEMGLEEMIKDLVRRTEAARRATILPAESSSESVVDIAVSISAIEEGLYNKATLNALRREWQVKARNVPVIGITGTGGAGKSSVTDEILNRFLTCFPDIRNSRSGGRSDAPANRWCIAG